MRIYAKAYERGNIWEATGEGFTDTLDLLVKERDGKIFFLFPLLTHTPREDFYLPGQGHWAGLLIHVPVGYLV